MSNLDIGMDTARDFARFVKTYGTKVEACIFQSEVAPEGRRYHDKVNTKAHKYEMYLPFAGRDATVRFVAVPSAPAGWNHANDKRVEREFGSKTELVKYLRNELKAEAEKLAVFAKITTSQLQQIVDSSDDDQSEITVRTKFDKDDKLSLAVNAMGMREVLVTVKKKGTQLEYVLSSDYATAWSALEKDVDDMLVDLKGFALFKTV